MGRYFSDSDTASFTESLNKVDNRIFRAQTHVTYFSLVDETRALWPHVVCQLPLASDGYWAAVARR